MPRRLPRSARLSLTFVKVALVASMVVAGLASDPAPSGPPSPGYAGFPVRDASDSPSASRESRLLAAHDCSASGFADATPLSAIVRSPRGQLRHVSFDVGWEVYSRHGAAQLVAVCLAEPPTRP